MVNAIQGGLVSVVIPAYNEAKRIGSTLERVNKYFVENGRAFEIIVVDDGSSDETSMVVSMFQTNHKSPVVFLRNSSNSGKGFSVRRGVLSANGEVILFSDADLSTPIEEFAKLEVQLREGCDVAIGSRALPESDLVVRQPWYRELMGQFLIRLVRGMGLTNVRDSQCGFKLFSRRAGRAIFEAQAINRFGFDVEILWLSRKLELKVAEVPVRWLNDSNSRVRPIIDSARTFIDVVRVYQRELIGRYPRAGSLPSKERSGG